PAGRSVPCGSEAAPAGPRCGVTARKGARGAFAGRSGKTCVRGGGRHGGGNPEERSGGRRGPRAAPGRAARGGREAEELPQLAGDDLGAVPEPPPNRV